MLGGLLYRLAINVIMYAMFGKTIHFKGGLQSQVHF